MLDQLPLELIFMIVDACCGGPLRRNRWGTLAILRLLCKRFSERITTASLHRAAISDLREFPFFCSGAEHTRMYVWRLNAAHSGLLPMNLNYEGRHECRGDESTGIVPDSIVPDRLAPGAKFEFHSDMEFDVLLERLKECRDNNIRCDWHAWYAVGPSYKAYFSNTRSTKRQRLTL